MGTLDKTDVVIIGGGPAGISAAIWCADLGLQATIFEKDPEFGGQLLRTFNPVTNYPGVETRNGRELRDKFLEQFNGANVSRSTGEVTKAELTNKTIEVSGKDLIHGRAIVIATGVRRRTLGIPGEDEFAGRGILDSGAASRDKIGGKTVAIVGGGDAALENALMLSEKAARVFVIHRGTNFSARDEFIRELSTRSNIEVLFGFSPTGIIGASHFEVIELRSSGSEKTMRLNADHLLIRVGSLPNTELFRGQIALDDKGYVQIDSRCETDVEGVFAAGDVASPEAPTVSTAVGQGAAAAKMIHNLLIKRK